MLSLYLFKKYFFSLRSSSLIRTVSWICFFGMSFSIASLILVTSIMGGLSHSIKKRILKKEAHVFSEDLPSSLNSLPVELQQGIDQHFIYETQDLLIKTQQGFSGIVARGYQDINLKKNEILIDEALSLDQNFSLNSNVILVSLSSFFLPPIEPLLVKQVKIKGFISDAKSSKNTHIHYKKSGLNFGAFSSIFHKLEIKLKDPYQAKFYLPYLKNSQTWEDRNSLLFFALKMEKFIMMLFITLSLIISCLGIASAMYLVITQKKQDIGIFHAIGLSEKNIKNLFLHLGFLFSFFSIGIGALLGIGITAFLKYTDIPFLPVIYEDRNIPAVFDFTSYLLTVGGSLALAICVCYFPIYKLAKLKPVYLLRSV